MVIPLTSHNPLCHFLMKKTIIFGVLRWGYFYLIRFVGVDLNVKEEGDSSQNYNKNFFKNDLKALLLL